jgi:choline dehydrogenase-like flavoprotein
MATNLKPVDVAVIGLGAAGGVAVLPLAKAGLKVAGIEAGTWMDPHSYRADEIHNNVRRMVTSSPKRFRKCRRFAILRMGHRDRAVRFTR